MDITSEGYAPMEPVKTLQRLKDYEFEKENKRRVKDNEKELTRQEWTAQQHRAYRRRNQSLSQP